MGGPGSGRKGGPRKVNKNSIAALHRANAARAMEKATRLQIEAAQDAADNAAQAVVQDNPQAAAAQLPDLPADAAAAAVPEPAGDIPEADAPQDTREARQDVQDAQAEAEAKVEAAAADAEAAAADLPADHVKPEQSSVDAAVGFIDVAIQGIGDPLGSREKTAWDRSIYLTMEQYGIKSLPGLLFLICTATWSIGSRAWTWYKSKPQLPDKPTDEPQAAAQGNGKGNWKPEPFDPKAGRFSSAADCLDYSLSNPQ